MQQSIDIQKIQAAVNQYGEIVIIKNKEDNVTIMSMEEYKKKKTKSIIIEKLKKSEREIEKGEGIDADIAFEELREKYGY